MPKLPRKQAKTVFPLKELQKAFSYNTGNQGFTGLPPRKYLITMKISLGLFLSGANSLIDIPLNPHQLRMLMFLSSGYGASLIQMSRLCLNTASVRVKWMLTHMVREGYLMPKHLKGSTTKIRYYITQRGLELVDSAVKQYQDYERLLESLQMR